MTQTLRGLANDKRTVIASIHQPSSEVFELFDRLCLLSAGKTIYFGEASQAYEASFFFFFLMSAVTTTGACTGFGFLEVYLLGDAVERSVVYCILCSSLRLLVSLAPIS